MSAMSSTAMQLVVLMSLLLLLLAPVSGANDSNDSKQSNLRLRNLRLLLNEGEVPALLSHQDCLALPVNDAGGSFGGSGCGSNLYWWPSWPYDNAGFCASGTPPHTTLASAGTFCANTDGGATTLMNMENNAERCIITHWANTGGATSWYWTSINDLNEEGTYVDGNSNPVPSVYLNWATGEPDGADEDCVMFKNSEAYDVDCANGPEGQAVCVKDVPAN